MIRFKYDIELEIVESFDEFNDTITELGTEVFKADQLVDADVVSEDGDYVDIQFAGSGGLALGIKKDLFWVVQNAPVNE